MAQNKYRAFNITVWACFVKGWFHLTVCLLIWAAWPRPGTAQPTSFGSADDPAEQIQTVWWRPESSLDVMGGLSLIGPQWRAATSIRLNVVTRPLTARLDATVRAGYYGEYGPDLNEAYDALRLINFVRYAPPNNPLYARIGPVQRMRLGVGHLVNFFSSSTAWDNRTIGGEVHLRSPYSTLSYFTDNLVMDGVSGARLALHPLGPFVTSPRLGSLQLGVSTVTDLATWDEPNLQRTLAYSVDAQFALLQAGSVNLSPFASYARYTNYGGGIGAGLDAQSDNFIDLARFRARLGLYYNNEGFIPGYFGSFYTVSNPHARIVNSASLAADRPAAEQLAPTAYAGVLLPEVEGGNDLVTELRLLIFDRFEFWYYFRRHYGSQNLSEYHVRLFVRTAQRFRLMVGQDRAGLDGFFSLFDSLDDQTALVFQAEYTPYEGFWIHIRSRYTYEELRRSHEDIQRYLVQRRFEPFIGLRFTF